MLNRKRDRNKDRKRDRNKDRKRDTNKECCNIWHREIETKTEILDWKRGIESID